MPGRTQHVTGQPSPAVSEKAVSLLSFEQCRCVLLEEEEIRWNRVLTSYKEEDNLTKVTRSSPGNIILSHAASLGNIHNYFCQLDARICRTKLTRSGCRTTFSNVRLVQGQCNKDRSVEEGAMMRQTHERANLDKLEDEDFQLYKDAILCAYFPKLCAPDPPPTPHTPSPGPRHVFTFTINEEEPSPILQEEMPLATNEDEDTSTLIQAETLCDILRKAFRLSEDRARKYDRVAFSYYSKKGQPKILAEELVSQLSVLETNKHPYYNPKAFVSRYAYDQWQQWERRHITQLLGKFWHYSYPPPVTLHTESLKGKHDEYKLLMKKLLGYESIYQTVQNTVNGPRTPLSSASRRLLKEFGLRYGVGEMYRKLVYLEYLTENFMNEPWFIQHVIASMAGIMNMLPSGRSRIIMTEDELELLNSCSNWLHGQCENSLTRIKRLFPGNRPIEGVVSLIQLLHKVLELKAYLSGEDQKPVMEYLMHYSLKGVRTSYERHKMLASHELMINAFDNSLSPELLNMVLARIVDEVTDYKNNYETSFKNYLDIAQEAAVEFYKLLMEDVDILCEEVIKNTDPDSINHLVLSLAYNLHQLDKDWAEYIPPESQSWHLTFLPQSLLWLSALKGHMQGLVINAVSKDKFAIVILPPDADLSQKSSVMIPCPRPRSSSLHSLSHSANSAFSSLSTRMTSSVSLVKESESSVIPKSRERHKNINGAHQNQEDEAKGRKRRSPIMQIADKIKDSFRFGRKTPDDLSQKNITSASDDAIVISDSDNSRIKDMLQFSKGHTITHSSSVPNLTKHTAADSRRGDGISSLDPDHRCGHYASERDYPAGKESNEVDLALSCPTYTFSDHSSDATSSYNEEEEDLLRQHRQLWLHYRDLKSHKEAFDEAEGQKLGKQLVALLGKRTRSVDFEACGNVLGEKTSVESGVEVQSGLHVIPKMNGSGEIGSGSKLKQLGHANPELLNHGQGWSSQQSLRVKTGNAPLMLDGITEPEKIRIHDCVGDWSSSDDDDDEKDCDLDPDRDFHFIEDVFKIKKRSSMHQSAPYVVGNVVQHEVNGISPQKKPVSRSVAGLKTQIHHAEINGNIGQGHVGSSQAHSKRQPAFSSTPNIGMVPAISANVGHSKQSSRKASAELSQESNSEPRQNMADGSLPNIAQEVDDDTRRNIPQPSPQNGAQHLLESFNQNGLNPVLTSELLLPISSSFLDTFITVHRYIRFGRFLFEVLLPLPKNRSFKMDEIGPFFSEILAGREKTYEKFVKGLCNTLSVYADNIVCLDFCAVPVDMSKKIIGKEMTDHLCSQQDSGIIWGCRHIINNNDNCFMYVNRKAKYLADRFEPVTQEMCCRVNILSTILKLLPKFKNQITEIANWKLMKKLYATNTRSASSVSQLTESMQDYEYVSSYSTPISSAARSNYTATPSDSGIAQVSESYLVGEDTFQRCQEHIQILMKGQLQLLAYRINLFLREALSLLLSLEMGNARVEKRLQPLSDFLGNYLKQMKRWLYTDLYKCMVENLWIYIVEDFNEEVNKLIHCKDKSKAKAEVLLQAVSFLMKFMSTRCPTLSLDLMMEKMDRVVFLLQLYTQPSERLIALYYQLYESCNQSEISSEGDDHLPTKYLKEMKHDLHLLRKCFSGEDLVNWIMKHPHSPVSSSEPLSGYESEASPELFARENAENVCQKLLDDAVIVGVDADNQGLGFFHSTGGASDIDISYPRMTRCPAGDGRASTPGSHDFEDPNAAIDQPWNDGHERHGVWTPFFYGQGLNNSQVEHPNMERMDEQAGSDETVHSSSNDTNSLEVMCGSIIEQSNHASGGKQVIESNPKRPGNTAVTNEDKEESKGVRQNDDITCTSDVLRQDSLPSIPEKHRSDKMSVSNSDISTPVDKVKVSDGVSNTNGSAPVNSIVRSTSGSSDFHDPVNGDANNPASVTELGVSYTKDTMHVGCDKDLADHASSTDGAVAAVRSEGTATCEGSKGTTTCEGSEGTTTCEGSEGTTTCEGSEGTTTCEGSEGTTPCERTTSPNVQGDIVSHSSQNEPKEDSTIFENDNVDEAKASSVIEKENSISNEGDLTSRVDSNSNDDSSSNVNCVEQKLSNGVGSEDEATDQNTETSAVQVTINDTLSDCASCSTGDKVSSEQVSKQSEVGAEGRKKDKKDESRCQSEDIEQTLVGDKCQQMNSDTVSCNEELEDIWQSQQMQSGSPSAWVDHKRHQGNGGGSSAREKPPKGSGDMMSDSGSSTPQVSSSDSNSQQRSPDCVNLAGSYRSASAFGPFAPRYIDSSTVVSSSIFQSSRQNLYCFKSIQDVSVSTHNLSESIIEGLTDNSHTHNNLSMLTGPLLQSAVDKDVSTNFLLTILYTRRKYDKTTKKFFGRVPMEMITEIKQLEESDVNSGCFG